MLFVVSVASAVPGETPPEASNTSTLHPPAAPSNTSSLMLGPQKTILGLSVDTFSYIFLSIGGAAPVIFILIVIVGMKCYSNRRLEQVKRERQMFQTSMELWEAERRYQATVADKTQGYEGPGLTALAEEQALDELSNSAAVTNGKIPHNSAHEAGLRISSNNPNVFFRETSIGSEDINSNQGTLSLERDSFHRNKKKQQNASKKNKNVLNENKRAKRNRNSRNKDRREMNSRNRRSKSSSKAFYNVTTESAVGGSNAVSMDTSYGGSGTVTKGHIVVFPVTDGKPSVSGNTNKEGGMQILHRQISSGTLPHSINSEERQALEVFDQIYEEHISDDERRNSHQGATKRKSSERRLSSLSKHRRHEYENTMYSVLGPGYQEGTTSFAVQSDTGEQSDAQSLAGSARPFKQQNDGNFYFTGGGEGDKPSPLFSAKSDASEHRIAATDKAIQSGDTNSKSDAEVDNKATDNTHKTENTPLAKTRQPPPSGQENLVTTITEQNDNGSVTSYTIRSNVATDQKLYHSTVIISQNSEIPPPLPSFSSHPSYYNSNTIASQSSSTIPRASDNDTEKWNTFYSNTTSYSNIDDYIEDSDFGEEQEVVLTNQNRDAIVPEYARVQKVDMRIRRIQQEDLSKAPSWLHKEFVNTAYISD